MPYAFGIDTKKRAASPLLTFSKMERVNAVVGAVVGAVFGAIGAKFRVLAAPVAIACVERQSVEISTF